MNNDEVQKLLNLLKRLKWNDKNLIKHTKKHPISESKRYGLQKWGEVLGFYDITENFDKTKTAYKEVSESILSNLSNSIIYFHDGPKENYRSIGIFEDKQRKENEDILTLFVQNKKNYFFITTCYLRKIGFKEKLYFAYELIKRPNQFKLNISPKKFRDKVGLPQDFDFSNIEDLTKDLDKNDLVLKAYTEYKEYGKPSSQSAQDLLYQFNFIIGDLKEIDKKIDLNNQVKEILQELYDEKSSEKIRAKYENKSGLMTCHEWVEYAFDSLKMKNAPKKNSKLMKEKHNIKINNSLLKLKRILKKIYETKELKTDEIIRIYEDFFEKINYKLSYRLALFGSCCEMKYLIEYLERKNKVLIQEREIIKNKINDNQEVIVYMSIYKFIINTHPDYCNKLDGYDFDYNDEIVEILR